MYEEGAFEANVLRQGDVIRDIDLLGAIHLGSITHNVTSVGGEPKSFTVEKKPQKGFAMVLSHCCEIDPANDVKLTSVILAPIRDVSTATASDKLDALIGSNDIEASGTESSFLKYFYVVPHDELPMTNGGVVDFSKCFSLRKKSYKTLVDQKILQLRVEDRRAMALKLGLFFSRA